MLTTLGPVEIRAYAPRIAASTTVQADEITARSTGFRRLAGYIFGGNTANTAIEMTAPVVQSPSTKIAMTAPVTQAQTPAGWEIQFIMPAQYTLQTLPRPNNPDIHIIALPAATFAVYRYTGARGPAAEAAARQILATTLQPSPWHAEAAPVSWFYDPPWTLPWFRRNEVAVPVSRQ